MKTLLTVIFTCTIVQAIENLRPGAVWNLRGGTYSSLEWLDDTKSKPTEAQVTAAIVACDEAEASRLVQKNAARFTVKLSSATQAQKLNALILLLDLDR